MPKRPSLSHSCRTWLQNFAAYLRAREGWSRALAAFAFGLATALAFAPVNFFPILWLSFPALIFLLQGTRSDWSAFVTGWSFSFGMFLLGLYWIAASMFVDIAQFWWAVPLAVAGLPAFFALYYGIASLLVRRVGLQGISGSVTFALFWLLADYARGHVFTGFPWNLEGYAWGGVLPMLEGGSLVGVYGLTLVTLLSVCLPACLAVDKKRNDLVVAASLLGLLALGAWGTWRLAEAPEIFVPKVRLRIVQPDIDQAHKWATDDREKNFHLLLALSTAPAEKPVTHIIWPETASTFYLSEDGAHRSAIAAAIPAASSVLTGVIRRSADADGNIHYYNSLVSVDGRARILAGYDKFHLVPFGEYIPLRKYLPIHTLVAIGDFTPGDGPHTLRVLGLPSFSPLICYEAIFPGDVTDRDDRPHFLLNVTNDGWYYNTAGPYQHAAIARMRAIEEGLPLVRAANTGISEVVDAYGRVTAKLGLGRQGFLDADLPEAAPATWFSRYGERPFWGLFGLFALAIGCVRLSSIVRK